MNFMGSVSFGLNGQRGNYAPDTPLDMGRNDIFGVIHANDAG
jgi:hypothetical protein